MKIENIEVEKLVPYEKNPRINNESVGHVMNSIKEFGFQQPIVVDKKNIIVIGHTRLLAAKKLKMETVPVYRATDLSAAQIKALRLADNKVGEKSFWDLELLRSEVGELAELGFDSNMVDFGFEGFEINDVFGDDEGEDDPDDAFEDDIPPAKNIGNESLKIRFEDVKEKSEAYSLLGVDPKKKAVDWDDVKRALNL